MRLGLHHNDCVSIRQWEHHFYTRVCVSRDSAHGITAGVNDVLCSMKFAHPGCLNQLTRLPVPHLEHLAAHPFAAVHWGQRNIELLQPSAEEHRKSQSKGPEQSMPFRPRIEIVRRSVLVKILHRRRDPVQMVRVSSESGEIIQQSAIRTFDNLEAVLLRVSLEELFSNDSCVSYRAIQPAVLCKKNSAARCANPLLGGPIGQIAILGA